MSSPPTVSWDSHLPIWGTSVWKYTSGKGSNMRGQIRREYPVGTLNSHLNFLHQLFPAKTLFCRELWFHPKKNCVRLSSSLSLLSLSSLSSLTESSPGFKALPIIRLSWAFNMLFLGTKLLQIRSFIKIGPPEGAPRPPSGGTSKNTKNAITLSFFVRFGPNLAQS